MVGQRTQTPAELVLGFSVRHPLVGCANGEKFLYMKTPDSVPVKAKF